MESENFDISLEWYYDDASYVSVGIWRKDVDNFIVNETFEDQPLFTDLFTPFEGELYEEAVAAITGGDPLVVFDNEDLNTYFVENFADHPSVQVHRPGRGRGSGCNGW